MAARGCEHCRGTGYSGRFALGEVLLMTPALKTLIARRATQAEILTEAAHSGWRSLRDQAVAVAACGLTTMDEVDRVAV